MIHTKCQSPCNKCGKCQHRGLAYRFATIEDRDADICVCLKTKRKRNKRIVVDGKVYRKRKGKLVEIPAEWVGQVPHKQTMNKRQSREQIGRRTRKTKKKR